MITTTSTQSNTYTFKYQYFFNDEVYYSPDTFEMTMTTQDFPQHILDDLLAKDEQTHTTFCMAALHKAERQGDISIADIRKITHYRVMIDATVDFKRKVVFGDLMDM